MKQSLKNFLIFAIVLFMISGSITIIGALAKLQHWARAGAFLNVGMLLNSTSYIVGGIALIQYIRSK